MKKNASRLAIVMTLILVFSMLFASMGVFAVDPEPGQDQEQTTVQNDSNSDSDQGKLQVQESKSTTLSVSYNTSAFAPEYLGVVFDNHSVIDGQAVPPAGGPSATFDRDRSMQKHVIRFDCPVGSKPIEVKMNGQSVALTPGEHDQYSIEVDDADTYTFDLKLIKNGEYTIIWANPDCTDTSIPADMRITHGNAHIIAKYTPNGQLIPMSDYTQQGSTGGVINGYGWAKAGKDEVVVFEFVPDYGYQLTSVAANETPLDPQEETNRYVFTMREGNVHFAATFTRTDDVVNTGTTKVRGGTVDVANNLDGGTAQLTVKDVELSADKIQGFQNAAGAYNVSQYLDIDLYNVFYKGKNDASDVWSNKIDELPNEATISLQLADGVNANDIVLVHNIHDGETFEVIPVESYDAATNTITFKTKSFSNYAIATKDGKKGGSKGPGTGDDNNIIPDLVIMITAGLALAGIGLKRRFDR